MSEFWENISVFIEGLNILQQAFMVFILSMPPILDRAIIPIAYAAEIPWEITFSAATAGNMMFVPFILIFVNKIFTWLRDKTKFGRFVDRIEARTEKRMNQIQKSQFWGIFLFVAVPLPIPGTGTWAGAMIAAMMNMRFKPAFISVFMGTITAGLIMIVLTYGLFDGLIGQDKP